MVDNADDSRGFNEAFDLSQVVCIDEVDVVVNGDYLHLFGGRQTYQAECARGLSIEAADDSGASVHPLAFVKVPSKGQSSCDPVEVRVSVACNRRTVHVDLQNLLYEEPRWQSCTARLLKMAVSRGSSMRI